MKILPGARAARPGARHGGYFTPPPLIDLVRVAPSPLVATIRPTSSNIVYMRTTGAPDVPAEVWVVAGAGGGPRAGATFTTRPAATDHICDLRRGIAAGRACTGQSDTRPRCRRAVAGRPGADTGQTHLHRACRSGDYRRRRCTASPQSQDLRVPGGQAGHPVPAVCVTPVQTARAEVHVVHLGRAAVPARRTG
jgi:hypothetical protein